MSYINCIMKKQQTCPCCERPLEISQNTQLYCMSCQGCPVLLEQQVKIVPNGYRPKSESSIPKNLTNVRSYLKKFTYACGFQVGEEDLALLSAEVMSLHKYKGGQNRKGYQENSAVIIFNHFRDQHRMTIRQFCKKCGVKESKFNKFYIDHCQRKASRNKIKRQMSQTYENQSEQKMMTISQPIQQQPKQDEQQNEFFEQVKKLMNKLFDQIFKGLIYRQLREDIIKQIVKKVTEYHEKVSQLSIDQYSSIKITQGQSILYMIFSIVKRAGLRTSFKLYKKKVHQAMGITLSNKIVRKFKGSYQKIVSDERATITSISTTVSAQGQSISQNQDI